MLKQILPTVVAIVSCVHVLTAFAPTVGVSRHGTARGLMLPRFGYTHRPLQTIFMSSSSTDDNNEKPRKRKRRRRKKPVAKAAPEETTTAPLPQVEQPTREISEQTFTPQELKPRQAGPVEMEIQDIRKAVGQEVPETPRVQEKQQPQKVEPPPPQQRQPEEEEEDENDDDEYEYYYIDDDGNEVEVPAESLNSLEQLLIDARQMEEAEKALKETQEKQEFSIPSTVRNILSTIVTVDFFFVCVLLLWFLAGVFGSYVLQNDSIQIAFNGIFQPVVQPALGILMIGSAAGAIFKEEEAEE